MAEHDSSGDYGYDMLDEVRAALDTPARGFGAAPSSAPTASAAEIDPDGDFGYDPPTS